MSRQIHERRRESLRFDEKEIKLIVNMLDQLGTTLDVMYYLLDRRSIQSFVLMLVSAENVNMHEILQEQKRDTDLLYCIDEASGLHAVICQETKVDGGYKFAERIMKNIEEKGGTSAYCTEIEVKATKYSIKDIVLRAVETFIISKDEKKENEIIFKMFP